MTNLENLMKKIIDDANLKAEHIMREAMDKKQQIIKEKEELALQEKKKIIDKAEQRARLAKERVISRAELQARDEKLAAKQEVIEKVFALAKEKLRHLDEKQYMAFLKKQLQSIQWKGTEILIVPEKYVEKVQELELPVQVSREEFVDSGFLVKDGNIVSNYSFEALVDFYRDEIEPVIAKDLFAGLE